MCVLLDSVASPEYEFAAPVLALKGLNDGFKNDRVASSAPRPVEDSESDPRKRSGRWEEPCPLA